MRQRVRPKKTQSSATVRSSSPAYGWLAPVLLVGIVLIVFGPTVRYEFINYDDDQYVFANPRITNGLSLDGILWAFTHVHADNWHPLTTISHMLDCQLFGLQPWGHHLMNVLGHIGATLLLLLALWELTGAYWPSACVAALFAIHPLRVESVAWVAERKDVLSGVFFMLTLWAYARFVRTKRPSANGYLIALLFFALGLLCKPTLVTLPFVLLLLDFWPLQRFSLQSAKSSASSKHPSALPPKSVQYLLVEKIPFLLLSAASCVATLLAQQNVTNRGLDFGLRLDNAAIAYVSYLRQMIWPLGLVPVYPYRVDGAFVTQSIFAALVILIISVLFFIWRRKYPFLLTGWLWFLGVLVPMIGIVQVGSQARADRYTYLSQIGLYILVTWGALALLRQWRDSHKVLMPVVILVITALTVESAIQTSRWRNSETLWTYTLTQTPDNALAHSNLGNALMKKEQLDDAAAHLRKAIEIQPNYPEAHNTLGYVLMKKGQLGEAVAHFQKALELKPELKNAEYNLAFARGYTLAQEGKVTEAITFYQKALEIQPNDPLLRNNLAAGLVSLGRTAEAIEQFREALRLNQNYQEAHVNLATLLLRTGRREEAVMHLREALRLNPNDTEVRAQLRELGQ